MMLKLRDSAIKSLQGVASGKISVEAHLQKEKADLMKEIEVLRAQVDRNQEVTKFATENLRLKEEIRRQGSLKIPYFSSAIYIFTIMVKLSLTTQIESTM